MGKVKISKRALEELLVLARVATFNLSKAEDLPSFCKMNLNSLDSGINYFLVSELKFPENETKNIYMPFRYIENRL